MYGGNESRRREIMKKNKLIWLLSVLLCTVIVLMACDAATEDEDKTVTTGVETEAPTEEIETEGQTDEINTEIETETETEAREPVDPILENFLGMSSETRWDEISKATRLDGDIYSRSYDQSMLAVRTADVDTKNIVTEKFTVYNIALKKAVLTLENKYSNSQKFDWYEFDFDDPMNSVYGQYGNKILPESIMKVNMVSEGGINLIRVSRATLTPVDKEDLKDNDYYGYLYEVDINYDFYDVTGTKIITVKDKDIYGYDYDNSVVIRFNRSYGEATAVFNADNMNLVRVTDSISGSAWGSFDAENSKYVYFLNGSLDHAIGYSQNYIEVYSKKTGERVIRHYCDHADMFWTNVLENGNVLLTYINTLDPSSKEPGDFYVGSEYKYTYDLQILDVKSGGVTDVDCDYVVYELLDKDTLADILSLRNCGITLTDNVLNIAVVSPIENKQLDSESYKLLFVDNDMNIMFEMDSILPEHRFGYDGDSDGFDLGFSVLPNGDYLVTLYGMTAQTRAIAKKDGTVRAYLTDDMQVVGNYVVTEVGIYDYDLKLLYEFGTDAEDYKLYKYATGIGSNIIVSRRTEYMDLDSYTYKTKTEYFKLEFANNAEKTVTYTKLFSDDAERIYDVSDNGSYVLVQNGDTNMYSLYNANFKLILKADSISVFESDGEYVAIVSYYLDGEYVTQLYTLE